MADEPFALSTSLPTLPADGDFDAVLSAVMGTARGRWFLEEFVRRNRNADTATLLAAFERIGGVIRGQQTHETEQRFPDVLIDVPRTIARTPTGVADDEPDKVADAGQSPPADSPPDVVAVAERLADMAWTMRERGIDPSTCNQIEALASTILSASSLHNRDDPRARQLCDTLQYLERRINAMRPTEAASKSLPVDVAAVAIEDLPVSPAFIRKTELAQVATTEGEDEPEHGLAAKDEPVRDEHPSIAEVPQEHAIASEVETDLEMLAMPVVRRPPAPDIDNVTPPAAADVLPAMPDTAITHEPAEIALFSETGVELADGAADSEPSGQLVPSMWVIPVEPQKVPAPTTARQDAKLANGPVPIDEPADFLLEPRSAFVPGGLMDATQTAPQADRIDALDDIERELFDSAPPVTATATTILGTEPPLGRAATAFTAAPPLLNANRDTAASTGVPASRKEPAEPANDPLAPLHAMSDEERIALFT
jgi:hypothetical protein